MAADSLLGEARRETEALGMAPTAHSHAPLGPLRVTLPVRPSKVARCYLAVRTCLLARPLNIPRSARPWQPPRGHNLRRQAGKAGARWNRCSLAVYHREIAMEA